MSKLVSVIIPAYNAEKTIEKALDSVLRQTWTDLEVIIVEDGALDGTAALVDALAKKDERVRVLHTPDDGVSAARNTGISVSKGELITFLDADDELAPEMISELVKLQEATGADIAGCGFGSRQELGTGEESERILVGNEIVSKGILQKDTRVWSKLYTRAALQGKAFPEGMTIGEDMLFLLDVVEADTKYARLAKKLYLYTVNPLGAMERPFTPSYFDQITCWERAEKIIEEKFPELYKEESVRVKLAALQTVSCLLVTGKIAKLEAGKARAYKQQTDTIREKVRSLVKRSGVKEQLPSGYGLKAFMLVNIPALYRVYYRSKA